MPGAVPPKPSTATLRRCLRRTTETLARELASPSVQLPDWNELEWQVAEAAAALHGVSSLLADALRWPGPRRWREFLDEQRRHTEERHLRMARVLAAIGARAGDAGIGIVPLKGAALHALGLYRPGERPMADLDLLVREPDREPLARVLATLGYRLSHVTAKDHVFVELDAPAPAALGEHRDNGIAVEIHTAIGECLPLANVDISAQLWPAQLRAGLNSYPSAAALMSHLLLHAAGDMTTRGVRLVQLNDIARLAPRLAASDWGEVLRPSAAAPGAWWLLPPLSLTARYYREAIPVCVLSAAAARCSRVLGYVCGRQRLSDVSGSDLRVAAFPGIVWAQSATEALRYVGARLRPSAALLAARQNLACTQPWAAESPWSRLPQGRRVLKWLLASQARPEALYTVSAALERGRHG